MMIRQKAVAVSVLDSLKQCMLPCVTLNGAAERQEEAESTVLVCRTVPYLVRKTR